MIRFAAHESVSRVLRAGVVAAGLAGLAALPAPRAAAQAPTLLAAAQPGEAPRMLILSDQARRFLALYRAFPTEFMGCMIGEMHGNAVIVHRIAPADVDPKQSTETRVIPKQTCEDAGWTGTVGVIHSHPTGERCWYFFPGTQVATSDAQSFGRQPYPVDAIMCGDRVVWISRDMAQQQVHLVDADAHAVAPPRQRGNPARIGSGAP